MIFFGQGFLTDNGLHGGSILCSRVIGVKLIRNWGMIFSIFLNSFLHQSGQRRKNVNWRINLLIMKLSINKDLAFSNVASKIWNWMGDIVVLN